MAHIEDDALEQYAMAGLNEPELSTVQEHLLLCGDCQERLRSTDSSVAAVRSAMTGYRL